MEERGRGERGKNRSNIVSALQLMYNQERAASVRAKEPTWLWALDRSTFQHVVRDYNINRKKKFYDILSSIPLCEASRTATRHAGNTLLVPL